MITLTEQDIQPNMRAVAHAVGQQELEGLKVPASKLPTFIVSRGARSTRMK
jgi:hypothetical protein